ISPSRTGSRSALKRPWAAAGEVWDSVALPRPSRFDPKNENIVYLPFYCPPDPSPPAGHGIVHAVSTFISNAKTARQDGQKQVAHHAATPRRLSPFASLQTPSAAK